MMAFFTSCSVEKRMHLRGYHVEWNKKTRKIHSTQNVLTEEKSIPAKSTLLNIKKQETINLLPGTEIKKPVQKIKKRDATHFNVKKREDNAFKKNILAQKPVDEKKTNIAAFISFSLSLLILAGLIVGIFWSPAIGISLLVALPAFICGLIGFIRIKRNPGVYNNKRHALLGIWIGFLGMLTAFILVMVKLYTHV